MKNKGYTLLELLGVIVILSLLITLVFPSVINFIKKSNDTKVNITNDLIISAAQSYVKDNSSNLYLTKGIEYCISVDTLIGKKYLTNIFDDDNIYIDKSVKVTYDDKINYEIINKNECSVCKLVIGEHNEIGSKYQCKVKNDMEEGYENGYYFYVFSHNENGTTNLIMERNIYYDKDNDVGIVATKSNANVEWLSEADYTLAGGPDWSVKSSRNKFGPVTAMNYLYNATKDWANIPNMIMDYDAEGNEGSYGYTGIKTEGNITKIINKNGEPVKVLVDQEGYINLKSRLVFKGEIWEKLCTTENGSCPWWFVNYMAESSYYTTQIGKVNLTGLNGFWLYSTPVANQNVNFVNYNGRISSGGAESTYYGVRPVITINLVSY